MKIAVTYENGQVFQHFGHTENFKIYEVENGKIISSEVIGTDGTGHEALADMLAKQGVEALVCGGLGGGASAALAESGIDVCSGAAGDADEAVEAYLRGELQNAGVNCDHHDHHEEEAGCGSGCGGSCHSCGGGCHGGGNFQPLFEGKNAGKTCRTHYRGTLDDGSQFDSSYDRGEPLEFVCAAGMMIEGFDRAVVDMEVGEKKTIHLTPDQAYGEYDPEAVFTVKISDMPGSESLEEGAHVYLQNMYGQPIPATVTEKTKKEITFDTNHELAGKALNFDIELVEVK